MGAGGLHELLVFQPFMRWPIFRQQIVYGPQQAIASELIQYGGQDTQLTYRRDALQRMTGYRAVRGEPGSGSHASLTVSTRHLAWRTSGESFAHYDATKKPDESARFTEIRRDTSGLPTQIGHYVLQYNAQRRLSQVRTLSDPARIVQYTYNAFGERILREEAGEQVHYLFDQNKLVAEARVTGTEMHVVRRYIYANHVPVAVIEYGRDLFMIHTDAVGLPHMMTDARQQIRWHATFTPHGELIREQGDRSLALRLPGQFADPLTGWHDNYQRTYDPVRGHYLEPDPLGPMPGNSLYGYADQQPRRHADPHGLMLFAFDGTGNQPVSLTNVWLFSKAYRDGPVHYIPGPAGDEGMSATRSTTDAAIAWSGGARVDQQWERLLNAIATMKEMARPIPVDIVGFSRGAALARHFGNRVVAHVKEGRFWFRHPLHGVVSTCVDMRFMGLFDTVAQFNVLGAGNAAFNLEVAPAWKWVSHAVALHEHRWLFPLTSASPASSVVERAFVGAHADIGGGYLTAQTSPGSTPGNLSQVALAWMQWQAQAAGVGMSPAPEPASVTSPIIHDERAVFARRIQNGDRRVNRADGTKLANYQSDLPRMGQGLRREVESFIRRHPHPALLRPDAVGLVDMPGYVAWLKNSMGFVW
jgi:RHS repeat-associated protein